MARREVVGGMTSERMVSLGVGRWGRAVSGVPAFSIGENREGCDGVRGEAGPACSEGCVGTKGIEA
jgi:hypothetical protein